MKNADGPRPYFCVGGLREGANNSGSEDEITMIRGGHDNSRPDRERIIQRAGSNRTRLAASMQRIQAAIPDFNPILVGRPLPGVSYSAEFVEVSDADRVRTEQEVSARATAQAITKAAAKAAGESAANLAAEAEVLSHWDGSYIVKLLETKGFNSGLVDELKTILNMIKHTNIMLFKNKNDIKIGPTAMRELHNLTVQVTHYFGEFGKRLDRGIDMIYEVEPHLPRLRPGMDPYQLRQTLKVWNARLLKDLAPVWWRDKLLYEGLAEFYDAQIYHSFLQLRRLNPKHDICKFTAQLDAIYESIEFLIAAWEMISREMHRFGDQYQAARERLLSLPEVYHHEYQKQVAHDRLEADRKRKAEALVAGFAQWKLGKNVRAAGDGDMHMGEKGTGRAKAGPGFNGPRDVEVVKKENVPLKKKYSF